MKIALCLHGLIGSTSGKSSENLGGSIDVLHKSYDHNSKYILDSNDVDVFVHSWSTECFNDIISLYKPKKFIIEPQIQFNVPTYIKCSHSRAFAHLSRWYSFKKVVELKTEYEVQTNNIYDLVLTQRFDLCWNVPVDLNSMDISKLTLGKSHLDTNREWQDQWFVCNSINMNKLSTLYDMIPVYMQPNGPFPSEKQYNGISSHFLVRYHAYAIGLDPVFKYNYGYRGLLPNDYTEIRRQYYEN